MKTMSSASGRRASVVLASLFATISASASTWTGGNGVWTSDGSPGWNGTGVPNAAGAVAAKTDNTSASITASGQTVGTFSVTGSSQATFGWASGGSITMNQDGAGSGFAKISNESTSTLARISIPGAVVLADDLLVSNTGNSINTSSISFGGVVSGTGNVTFSNVSNSTTQGHFNLSVANTFTGNVLVEKGAVVYTATTGLGNAANAVTLGSAGNSATLLFGSNNNTTAYNITVAATTGTNVLGSTSTSTSASNNTTFSGALTLNGNVSLSSVKGAGADVRFTGAISGVGGVTTIGTGEVQFGNGSSILTNTYQGNTTIGSGSTLVLADNAALTFYIGADGVNNKITGLGTASFDGDFVFDLTGAAANGSWTIVDTGTLSESFSSTFFVQGGFTQASDVWTKIVGDTTYTFTEANGVLTAVTAAIPEPSSAGLAAGLVALAFCASRSRRRAC